MDISSAIINTVCATLGPLGVLRLYRAPEGLTGVFTKEESYKLHDQLKQTFPYLPSKEELFDEGDQIIKIIFEAFLD